MPKVEFFVIQNLTSTDIRALPTKSKEYQINIGTLCIGDDIEARLQVRVRENGSKAYILRYIGHHPSKRRYETIGSIRRYSIDEAKKAAHQIITEAYYGDRKTLQRQSSDVTFGVALEIYAAELSDKLSAWHKTAYSHIRQFILPGFVNCKLKQISRSKLLELIQHQSSINRSRGRNLLAAVRAFLSWCADKRFIEANPLWHVLLPSPAPRVERFLSVDELAAIYLAAERLGFPWHPMVAIAIATGEAMEDIRKIRIDHIDPTRAIWFQQYLSGGCRSGGREIYLGGLVWSALGDLSGRKGYLFISPREMKRPQFQEVSPVFFRHSMVLKLNQLSCVSGNWGLWDIRTSVKRHIKRFSKTDNINLEEWIKMVARSIENLRNGTGAAEEEDCVVL